MLYSVWCCYYSYGYYSLYHCSESWSLCCSQFRRLIWILYPSRYFGGSWETLLPTRSLPSTGLQGPAAQSFQSLISKETHVTDLYILSTVCFVRPRRVWVPSYVSFRLFPNLVPPFVTLLLSGPSEAERKPGEWSGGNESKEAGRLWQTVGGVVNNYCRVHRLVILLWRKKKSLSFNPSWTLRHHYQK